jgi:acyl-CoA ligase (AMP-forming) (exosortase A-associated)
VRALFHQLVESASQQYPDAPALVFKDESLSYRALWGNVLQASGALLDLEIERYDRVAVYLEKRIETVVAMFGTAAAGGVFVPINPLLRGQQVAHILNDCGVKVLVTSPERLEALQPNLGDCAELRHVVVVGADTGTTRSERPVSTWDDLLDGSVSRIDPRAIDTDLAAILYTSGSTGSPKGVMLSHRNVVAGAESVSHYLRNVPEDRILALLPLSFDAGLSQLTTGFHAGSTVVLMNFLFARDVVRICEAERITGITGVPPLWIKLAGEEWPAEVGERFRYFANTGGHMPRPLLEKLRSIFPEADPYLMYGLTEAFRSTYLDPGEVDRRPDSIGKAIPNAEVMVVGEDGAECGPGEIGELVHRGALVSMGYWNSPELTALRFRPAPGQPSGVQFPEIAVWSGDLARKDEDGFIYFIGRTDDMIKTSGYRVSPTEVEEVVFQTGLVSEAAAVGIPDEELGQAIVVVAVSSDGTPLDGDRLREECRRALPLYMVPADFVARDALPRNPNGKLDRQRIRADLLDFVAGHSSE